MASDDRFYLLEFRNRPVLYGDIGSLLRIEGVVVGGGGASAVLLLPGLGEEINQAPIHRLTIEDWSDFIRRSDDPEILIGPKPNGSNATLPKIFQRKLRYEISGAVQQKVWAADGFQCVYCGRKMGNVLMTIDHFIPLELGGANDVTNFVSSCKPCNKSKGSQDPKVWLTKSECFGTAEDVQKYLRNRKI
jgi:hypothetical protein